MKPYNRKFTSLEEAKEYFQGIGRLQFFGRAGAMYEYCVYNFHHHNTGKKYHMNIWENGRVEYEEMSPVQYEEWRDKK